MMPQPASEQRELLLLQVLAATGSADPDRAAVCADVAGRFRADPLDDDAFLAFQARCGQWDGIAQAVYFAILADCTHVSEIGRTDRDRALVTGEEEE